MNVSEKLSFENDLDQEIDCFRLKYNLTAVTIVHAEIFSIMVQT
jgi:hypothetical protein